MRAWVEEVEEREGRRRGKEGEREGRIREEGEGRRGKEAEGVIIT